MREEKYSVLNNNVDGLIKLSFLPRELSLKFVLIARDRQNLTNQRNTEQKEKLRVE